MVAPPLAFSNSARQASWAASWELAPAPATSPDTSAPPPLDELLPLASSLLPQAATPSAKIPANATTASHLVLDICLPLFVGRNRSGFALESRPWRPDSQW